MRPPSPAAAQRHLADVPWTSPAADSADQLVNRLFDCVPVGMALLDRRMRYLRVSESLAAINGLPAASHVGKSIWDVLPPNVAELTERHVRTVFETQAEQIVEVDEDYLVAESRHRYWVALYFPLRGSEGTIVGVGAVLVEITGRKRNEEAVTEQKEQLERLTRAREHYLAQLTHELRTPLTPVLAAAAAMQQDPSVSPQVRAAADIIRRNAEMEARLVDDLLELTRAQRGKLSLKIGPLDVHLVIRHALDAMSPQFQDKSLTLDVQLAARNPTILADDARLQQILCNLLSNSAKFTPAGGTVGVRTGNLTPPDAPPRLRLEVWDTGIGMDPRDLSVVFGAFEQTTEGRKHSGLGLGLAIAEALTVAQGGDISAHSAGVGHGSCFVLTFPLQHPDGS